MGKICLGLLVLALVLTGVLVVVTIDNNRVDTWLMRAKDAGNPAQVAEFLTNYNQALYDKDRVVGHYYSVFRYPATDMTTYIRIIDGLIVRAEALAKQSPTDASYQMGLINLEKDLGDIDARCFSVWFAGGGFIIVWLMGFAWASVLVLGVIAIGQ